MNVSPDYVGLLFGGWDGGTSFLQTIYGHGARTTGLSNLTPAQALRAAENNQSRDIKRTAAQPEVKRAIDAFNKAVDKATSVDQLLRDPAVLEVFLTANGLGDQRGSPALARKALTSSLDDPNALANRLADSRWKDVVKTFDFAAKGMSVIKDPAVRVKLTDAYAEVKWRLGLDQQTPGLSNTLTSCTRAASVTSPLQILGDPVQRDVVTTALEVPKQIAFQSLDAQVKAIDTRLEVKKLQDPEFVEAFVQRYLLAAANNASTEAVSDLTTLASKLPGLVI